MKKTIFFFFSTLILLSSCHKEGIKDIVHTDTNGNIISKGDGHDWTPATIVGNQDAASALNQVQTYLNYVSSSDTSRRSFLIKRNCTVLPDTLEIYPYANPISNTQNLNIRLRSSVPICFFDYRYEGLASGDGGGDATAWATGTWLEGKKTIDFNIAGVFAFPTGSMKLTFYVITVDSCAYTASGIVLVQ